MKLTWLELIALRILQVSPRVSLLITKTIDSPELSYSVSRDDQEAIVLLQNMLCMDDLEPPSMVLERLYHAPAYGESE
jgi:hypothetical protein